MSTIKVEPDKAKKPSEIGKFTKCPKCKTVYPVELPRCPMCAGSNGSYYLS